MVKILGIYSTFLIKKNYKLRNNNFFIYIKILLLSFIHLKS